jgi:bifunctional enzyme CysN/CysC
MSEQALLPGRSYAALIHTKATGLSVTQIKYRIDVNTGAHLAAKTIALNESQPSTLASIAQWHLHRTAITSGWVLLL